MLPSRKNKKQPLIHVAFSKPAPITRRASQQGTFLPFYALWIRVRYAYESPGKPTDTLCLANLQRYVQAKPCRSQAQSTWRYRDMIKHISKLLFTETDNSHMQILAIRAGGANLPDPSGPISKFTCWTLQENQFKGWGRFTSRWGSQARDENCSPGDPPLSSQGKTESQVLSNGQSSLCWLASPSRWESDHSAVPGQGLPPMYWAQRKRLNPHFIISSLSWPHLLIFHQLS